MIQKIPLIRFTLILLFATMLLNGLVMIRDFLYPIFLAMLLAFLIYPFSHLLENKGMPRILANLLGILLFSFIIASVIFFIYNRLELLLQDFPQLKQQALENAKKLENFINVYFGISPQTQKILLQEQINNMFESGNKILQSAFIATTGTLTTIGLLPVYIFFLLFYRNKFKNFILMIIKNENKDITNAIIDKISYVIRRYMTGVVTVVLILCFLNSIGLLIVGVQYAILLGIISALFNFIPYFGTLIGGIVPFMFALLIENSPTYAVGVLILFIIIQFIENNILTPNITGGNVSINPFFTILSIIAGGMLWGIPGMLLVVPIMGIIKIICEHFEELKPYAYLLGVEGNEKHALSFNKIKNYIRRIF